MADSRGFPPNPSLGRDLRAGHIHRDQYRRSPAPSESHRPVRNKRKSLSVSSHASNPERPNIPERTGPLELPRLRALEAHAAAVPISSSAASSVSPRSGSSRVHPYPVGEALEGSSFEVVPSTATQAARREDHEESMEVTPIRDTQSNPCTPRGHIQVMSPNLEAGMASGSTQGVAEQEVNQATARAILQSWSEVTDEDGTVARTFTQCAQTWPLADAIAFENIDAALSVLRQACDYLHNGQTQVGTRVEQKADISRVQSAAHELADHIQDVRNGLREETSRQNALSTRLDADRLQAAYGRLEMMSAQVEQGLGMQSSQMSDLQRSMTETQRQVVHMDERLNVSQADTQKLDKGLSDLQENVFYNASSIDRVAESCKRQIAQVQTLSGQQISVEAYQEHARGTEHALEQCRSQLADQAVRIETGERRMARLQDEVVGLTGQHEPRAGEDRVPNRDPELAIRLSQLEDGLKSQQKALAQLREDSTEDARSIKQYLDQVHDLVTTGLQKGTDSIPQTPERTNPESTRLIAAARKGDSKVEVEDSGFCRIGEIVLIGGQEARTVLSKSSLIFRSPLQIDYPEGMVVRHLGDNEFLQLEGENLYVYARGPEGETHFVCGVDLIQRETPERAEDRDEDLQDQVCADDLDQRVQRAVDARLAAQRPMVSGEGGRWLRHGLQRTRLNGSVLERTDKCHCCQSLEKGKNVNNGRTRDFRRTLESSKRSLPSSRR